jgi:photosystem II stability/assembly factor-like uncharacterized protein
MHLLWVHRRLRSRQRWDKAAPKQLARTSRAFEALEVRLVRSAIQDWTIRGAGGGGALFEPSINPTDPSEIYIASDMGQIFHTTSGGALWDTIDHRQLESSDNSKVEFTINPQILYTVDYSSGGDVVRPTKSTDGGATWTPTADPTSGGVITLLADYNNANRLLVSDYSRLFISADGGTTFTQVFSTTDSAGLHVAGAFFDGGNIYVGTNQGVLVSTNGGASFSVAAYRGIPSTERIVSFAGAKQGGVTRFWAITSAAADVYAGTEGWDHDGYVGIYRLDVGQTAWTSITSGIASGVTPFFVSAALNDINTVYVGGGSSSSRPTVYRSTNGGSNWQSVLETVSNANVQTGWSGDGGARGWSYGETALGFSVSPLDPSRVIITDFGFAHYSQDSGASWHALYVIPGDLNPAGAQIPSGRTYHSSGLDNTSSWDLTWTGPSHMIGSFSDVRSEVSADGGNSWSFNYSGVTQNSMYRSVVQPATGVVYAATASVHDMYQSTHLTDSSIDGGAGAVLFSTDGGTTWQTMHDFGHVVMWVQTDPANSNRLYAAVAHSTAGGIYVTNNAQLGAASTWTKLAPPPRTQGHTFNIRVLNDGTLVVSYSGRRDSAGAFTASSGVFVSTDGGQTWQDRSDPGMQYWTKDVVIDPHDPTQNTWYASVFSGWGGPPNGLGGLYRTTNRGQTWMRINALDRVNSVTVSPTNPNEAYLTTETDGLWYTENLTAANPTFTEVAGYKFMQPMRVVYNPYDANEVWVTSFGGGLRAGHIAIAGDLDRNGAVTVADLGSMMGALANVSAYQTSKGLSDAELITVGDVSGDGAFNNVDLQALIVHLANVAAGGGAAAPAMSDSRPLAQQTAVATQHSSIASRNDPLPLDSSTLTPMSAAAANDTHSDLPRKNVAIIPKLVQDGRTLLPVIDNHYSASDAPSITPENRHLRLRDLLARDESETIHDEFFRHLALLNRHQEMKF